MNFKDISEIDEEISATESQIRSVQDPSGAGKPLKSSLERRLNLLKGAKINFNKTINVDVIVEQVPKRFKTSNDILQLSHSRVEASTKKFKLPTNDKLNACDVQSQPTAFKRNGYGSQYHPASNVSEVFQEFDHNVVESGIGVNEGHTKEGM